MDKIVSPDKDIITMEDNRVFKYTDGAFDIPINELIMILPQQREALFLNFVTNFSNFNKDLKLLYAAMNFDKELKVDYLIIYQINRFILWDNPFIYTERSIPGYRYIIKHNMYKEFFIECRRSFSQISIDKFFEFIGSNLCGNLSQNPKSPDYWKDPNNAPKLIKGMVDMSMQYVPQYFKSNRSNARFGE